MFEDKTLFIIRGVSGSGKSTFARNLEDSLYFSDDSRSVVVAEADHYHYNNGVYEWKAENQQKAHLACQAKVRNGMCKNLPVILSNTSTTEKELKIYLDMAKEFGYIVVSLVVENRHGNKNVHNVPDEILLRQQNNLKSNLKLV